MPLRPADIRSARPSDRRQYLRDSGAGGVKGLFCRVDPSGLKVWYLQYIRRGKRRRFRIGEFPEVTLGAARRKARRLRAKIVDGADPQVERRSRIEAITVRELVDQYLAYQEQRGKVSIREDRRFLDRTLVEHFGDRAARTLTRADVREVMRREVRRSRKRRPDGSVGAVVNRVLASIHACLRWALGEDLIEQNPAAGIRKPAQENVGDRVLTPAEIGRVWSRLEDTDLTEPLQIATRLLFLLGLRRSEVICARWAEVDLEEGALDIPAERMKARRPHYVPLPHQAVDLLQRQRELSPKGAEFVFENKRTGTANDPESVRRGLVRNLDKLEVDRFGTHDIRRSVAENLERHLRIPPHVVSAILAHTPPGITKRHYSKYSYTEERAEALQRWADFVEGIGDD